jgi:S1-C subfamily serine protease
LVYNPLTPEAVIRIAKQEIDKLAANYGLEVGFIAPALLAEIADETAETEFGARPIKEAVAFKLGKEFAAFGQTHGDETKSVDVVFSADGYKVTPALKDQKEFPQDDLLGQSITIYKDKAFDRSFIDAGKISEHFNKVYCQEDNIKQLINTLEIWYAQVRKSHPLSFYLVGTSGVGKTYTSELLAEALQPLGYEHCYFAMSECQQENDVNKLIGSPRGYVGSEEEPKLFAALKKSSKLVICFDEIDKAHERVRVSLMQLLDKGYLSWNKGDGDFSDCIIFLNSNAKKKELVELKKKYLQKGKSIDGSEFQNAVRDVLTKDGFSSEWCGRLNSLLVYNPLTPEAVIRIAKQEIDKLAANYGLEVGFIAPALLAEIAGETAETEFGARPIKDNVAKELGKLMIKARKDKVNDKIAVNKTDQGYSIDPASQNNKAVSDEEIIRQAETIVSTMQTESSSKSNKPDGKPKRILKLSELPTMIREVLKTDASASEPTIINSVNPAVGYVEIEDFAGEQSSGSGFVITPEGIMITSFHVVESAHKIMVRFDTSPSVLFPASFIDGDKDADIALLKLEGKDFPYALLAPYGERVEIGEKVGLLGYPLGEDLGQLTTYTSGVLSSYRSLLGQGGPLLYQIDAGAYHGSSGGPLIRIRDGRVIGILAGGRKEISQFNFAISSNEIFKRLVSEY